MVFSPPTDPKVATKVDTLVGAGSGGKGLIFYLEGTDKEKELLRLKGEFKKIRSSNKLLSTAPPSASVVSASSSSSSYSGAKRSAAQTIINESGEDAQKQARLKQRKLNLLSADKQLAKSYRELVESTHIVSEEEFWSMHVNPSLLEDKETQVQQDRKAVRAKQDYSAKQVLQVFKVHKAFKVHRVCRVLLVLRELLEHKGFKAYKVLKVHKAQ
jgi:hypothetical protein